MTYILMHLHRNTGVDLMSVAWRRLGVLSNIAIVSGGRVGWGAKHYDLPGRNESCKSALCETLHCTLIDKGNKQKVGDDEMDWLRKFLFRDLLETRIYHNNLFSSLLNCYYCIFFFF